MGEEKHGSRLEVELALNCLSWEELNKVAYPDKVKGFYDRIFAAIAILPSIFSNDYESFEKKNPRYRTLIARWVMEEKF